MGIKEIFDVVVAMLEVIEESMGSKENTGKAEALEYEERIGIAQSILAPIWGDRVATETYLKLTKRALSLNVDLECWYDSVAKRKVAWLTVPVGSLLGQQMCNYLSSGKCEPYFTQKDHLRVRNEGRHITGQINYNVTRIEQLLNIIFIDVLISEASLFLERVLRPVIDTASAGKESDVVTREANGAMDDITSKMTEIKTRQMGAGGNDLDIVGESRKQPELILAGKRTGEVEEPEEKVKTVNMDSLPRGWREYFPEVKAILYLKMRAWELGGTLQENYTQSDLSNYWVVLTAPCKTPVYNAMITYSPFKASDSSDVLILSRSSEKVASWKLPLTNRETFAALRSLFELAEEFLSNTAEKCYDLVRARKDVHSRALKRQHFVELLQPIFIYGHTYDVTIEEGKVKIFNTITGALEMEGDTEKMILGYLIDGVESMDVSVMLSMLDPFWMYYGCLACVDDGKVVVYVLHERHEIQGSSASCVLEQILSLIGERV